MKKTAILFLTISLLASCGKEMSPEEAAPGRITLECALPVTRAYLDGTSFVWNANDVISIYNGNGFGRFVNRGAAGASVATFDGTIRITAPEEGLWAVYPYNAAQAYSNGVFTFNVQSRQSANRNLSGQYPFIAHTAADSRRLAFRNVLGGVAFTLKRNDICRIVITAPGGEALAGDIKVRLGADGTPVISSVTNGSNEITLENAQGCFATGTQYYVPMIPQTLSKGLVFRMFTRESSEAVQTVSSAKAIKRSTFGILKLIDGKAAFTETPANCYIAAPDSEFSFEARYGVSTEKLTGTFIMSVRWESTGTAEAPAKGSVVRSVIASGGKVTVKTGSQQGNAVIVATSLAGTVLWSWHIWVTRETPAALPVPGHPAMVMDRNLGALSGEGGNPLANGLFYQYDRKDPFPGAASLSSDIRAEATPALPAPKDPGSLHYTTSYATTHPDVFIICSSQEFETNTLHPSETDSWNNFGSQKSRQDPCPAGWTLKKDFFVSYIQQDTYWKESGMGRYDKGADSPWFPACGYLDGTGQLADVGRIGHYWLQDVKHSLLAGSTVETRQEQDFPAQSVRCVAL